MLGLVHGAADLSHRQDHAGRGLVVDGEHGLDLVRLVLGEALGELGDVGALAPVGGEGLDLDAEIDRHLRPALGEIAGLDDHHGIAGGEQVGQRGFPRTVAARIVHVERLVGLQDPLHAGVAGVLDGQELVRHEVEHRPVHRPQYAVGNIGRAGVVEELASAGLGIHVGGSGLRKVPELRGVPLAKQARLAMVGH